MRLLFVLSLIFLFSLAAATECTDKCQADYDTWIGYGKNHLNAKDFYCGTTETNCPSRESVPSGQADPCWSLCYESPFNNNAFQQCCYASWEENSKGTLDQCIAECPNETAPATCTGTCEFFQKQLPAPDCSCVSPIPEHEYLYKKQQAMMTVKEIKGTVWIKKGGKPPRQILKLGDSFQVGDILATSEDGEITLEQTFPDDTGVHRETLGRLQTLQSVILCEGKPCLTAQSFASSEHSSVRGTINGGGDFILIFPLTIGLPVLDVIMPPKDADFSVYEETTNGTHVSVYSKVGTAYVETKITSDYGEYQINDDRTAGSMDVYGKAGTVAVSELGETPVTVSPTKFVTASDSGVSELQEIPYNWPGRPEPAGCNLSTGFILAIGLLVIRRE
ncbi:MAG: hypothetical protein V1492_04940 [Candidatus Micrarchaeota archaeon]